MRGGEESGSGPCGRVMVEGRMLLKVGGETRQLSHGLITWPMITTSFNRLLLELSHSIFFFCCRVKKVGLGLKVELEQPLCVDLRWG